MATHVDPAPRHREPQVPAHVAVDRQLTSRHPGADRIHARKVSLDPDHARVSAADLEKLPERPRPASVHHRQLGDLLRVEPREPICGDAVGDEHVIGPRGEGEGHRVAHARIFRR